jgi:hypothetical protein
MTITDRQGLEAASCSCYAILRAEYRHAFDAERGARR